MILTIKYTLFAMISTLFNLLFQYISFLVYNGALELYVGMLWGILGETGAAIGLAIGYVTKYHLDKRFVFRRNLESA